MNKLPTLSALLLAALAASGASAQEMGRVISSTPIVQQVAMPQQVCSQQQVVTPGGSSGAGAVMGAIAGGAVGNSIGRGGGRAVATMAGVLGGAILGDRIEGAGQPQVRNVQNCGTQTSYENRTVGYNVTYEYAGHQYTAQMPNDPGLFVPVQVSPAASATYTAPVAAQPVYVQPPVVAPVYSAPPAAYPGYYAPQSGYPATTIEFNYEQRSHRGWH